MLRSLVKRVSDPSVVGLALCLGLALPGFLLLGESAKKTGAQGDLAVQRRSSCPLPRATVRNHQFHVSGVYARNLISAIRFSIDGLNCVLYYSSVGNVM